MENLNKMTYEEKTDYLVARIDALTEKVEKLIEMVDPKCPNTTAKIADWYKERNNNYIIVVDMHKYYLIFLYDQVFNTITRSTIDGYIIDSDSLFNALSINNNMVRFTTNSDVIKDMINIMYVPYINYEESVSRFWSVFNSL